MVKKNREEPEKITEEQKEELNKKDLPEFREREAKKSQQEPEPESPEKEEESGPGSDDDDVFDFEEICRDLSDMPFQIWCILNPNVPPLAEKEKDLIAKYVLRTAKKYKIKKYMRDELLLLAVVGYSVMKRIGIKKNVDDDSGEEGERQDEPGQEDHPG